MTRMEDAFRKAGFKSKRQERRDRSGGSRNRPPREALPEFPSSYFEVDDDGQSYLLSVFVSKERVDPLAAFLGRNARPELTNGQMRRFFNHCREIERQLKVDGESWHRVSASFESLGSHAQYAVSSRKIPNEFQKFIDDNVKRVAEAKNPKNAFINGFLPHFEALVGFSAKYMKDR